MSRYEWLLFLHVLGAFAIGTSIVLYGGAILAGGGPEPRAAGLGAVTRLGDIAFNAGGVLTLVFGIWLAIDVDGYELWDGWIAAAIVLWFVAAELGRRLSRAFAQAGRPGRAAPLYALLSAVVLAFLVLMIWKPGA